MALRMTASELNPGSHVTYGSQNLSGASDFSSEEKKETITHVSQFVGT